MRMKIVQPTPDAEKFRNELLALCQRHNADDKKETLLAIASYAVGQLIALQDQRTMTQDKVMKLISANIEAGNKYVIDELAAAPGGKA